MNICVSVCLFVLVSEMSALPCLGTSLSVCVVCIWMSIVWHFSRSFSFKSNCVYRLCLHCVNAQLLIKCSLCFQSMAVETCGRDVLHVCLQKYVCACVVPVTFCSCDWVVMQPTCFLTPCCGRVEIRIMFFEVGLIASCITACM